MIRVENVSKTYGAGGQGVTALKGVSLDIPASTFVTVVGPSGCGKSTLLKLVAGLDEFDGGSITVREQPMRGPRDDVGIMYQKPVLLPWRTVLENTLLPVHVRRFPVERFRARADELLTQVGLTEFANHYPTQLSGGMAQRNAITRALILDPTILLMDEPFGALDAITRENMMLLLAEVWETTRKTVLFITHSIQEAIFLGDRVVVMSARPGRVMADVAVDIPRPRTLDVMTSARFTALSRDIRELLHVGTASTQAEGGI